MPAEAMERAASGPALLEGGVVRAHMRTASLDGPDAPCDSGASAHPDAHSPGTSQSCSAEEASPHGRCARLCLHVPTARPCWFMEKTLLLQETLKLTGMRMTARLCPATDALTQRCVMSQVQVVRRALRRGGIAVIRGRVGARPAPRQRRGRAHAAHAARRQRRPTQAPQPGGRP